MDKHQKLLGEIITDLKNWSSLKIEISKYNFSNVSHVNAGKLFEIFTKLYFEVLPEEKVNYRQVWLYDEVPQSVKEQLNLTSVEHGVDLILQDFQNQYFAVQCKFRNDENSKLNWTADKIANLFAYCPKADGFIVFTNASDLDKVSKTRHDNFSFYNVNNLLEIDNETFSNIDNHANQKTFNQKQIIHPRPHQQIAINDCVDFFQIENRGQLILPCGAGKTLTALWIKERIGCSKTLVLVPSLALLRQIKNEWSRHRQNPYQYICVCSEGDIDSDTNDNTVVHTYEIGGRVTTNPSVIRNFLEIEDEKVIFSTYQSLKVIVEAIKDTNIEFDFVFCDEAHKTAGIGNNMFSIVHDNKLIPTKRRLYATATPRIVKESLKKKLGDDLQYAYDMGDFSIFGEEFYRMSFKEAIEQDILVDYKIIAVGVNDKQLEKYIKERRYHDKNLSSDELANNYALDYVMSEYNATHALTFHSRVKFAETFAKRHRSLFPQTKSFSVSGEQSTNTRNLILREFRNAKKSIVSNARCLTEGVDVPAIDLVYFCDPKNSKVDIVQAVGRALRKKEGKKMGYVVIPIYHSDKNELDNSINTNAFKNLIQVIQSLCDQDERLQDEINLLAFGKSERKSSVLDVITLGQKTVIQLIGFEKRLQTALFEQIIEKNSNNWDVYFLNLKDYLETNSGNYPSKEDRPELHSWVSQQRNKFGNKKLNNEQKRKLESIGFVWDAHEYKWDMMFEKLQNFADNSSVPPTKEVNKELAQWYSVQKISSKNGSLRNDRAIKIESIKFTDDFYEQKWLGIYTSLVEFRSENPNRWPQARRDRNIQDSEITIGIWCQNMRKRYREGQLSEQRLDKLLAIDFNFDGYEDNWMSYYNKIKKIIEDGVNIIEHPNEYSWVLRHTKLFKENSKKLTYKQIQLLNELNVEAYDSQEKWNQNLAEVKSFLIDNNQLPTKGTNKKLYSWLRSQKMRYSNGTLPKNQIELLEEIEFNLIASGLEKIKERWLEQLENLTNFINKNNGKMPSFYSEGHEKELYNWCQAQRQAESGTLRRRKPLQDWQREKLDSINFNWAKKVSDDETWQNNFESLTNFLKINEIVKLAAPINGKANPLYSWLQMQKNNYRMGKILPERQAKLEEIGIILEKVDGRGRKSERNQQ